MKKYKLSEKPSPLYLQSKNIFVVVNFKKPHILENPLLHSGNKQNIYQAQ